MAENEPEKKDQTDGKLKQSVLDVPPLPTDSQTARNEFTSRKTAAQAVMDAALLMANISQLRMLLAADGNTTKFYIPLLCLVIFSVFCQVLFAMLVLVIWARESRLCKTEKTVAATQTSPQTSTPPSINEIRLKQNLNLKPRTHQRVYASSPGLLHGRMVSVDIEEPHGDEEEQDFVTQKIHVATLILVFLITITNMFITGLGFEPADAPIRSQISV